MKAAWFIDLDGTIFEHGTHNLLPGAKEFLDRLIESEYHQVIFTTLRGGSLFPKDHPVFSKKATLDALEKHFDINIQTPKGGTAKHDKKKDVQILFSMHSPRIVMNDQGAFGMQVVCNQAVYPDEQTLSEMEKDLKNAQQ